MTLRTWQSRRNLVVRAAFTLMELLVVMAIIVIIAGFGGYYVLGQLDRAKVNGAIQKARAIVQAAETYKVDHGDYPQDLSQLLVKDEEGRGPYLKSREDLLDPWGRPFQYDPNGTQTMAANQTQARVIDVFTVVPGENRTIGNWSK
ncbi:MAG: type II secretion system protein GspG [Gemmataceae bacterium]|nr:type II secretion system protein GspG [Gemmataceae bacterium]